MIPDGSSGFCRLGEQGGTVRPAATVAIAGSCRGGGTMPSPVDGNLFQRLPDQLGWFWSLGG